MNRHLLAFAIVVAFAGACGGDDGDDADDHDAAGGGIDATLPDATLPDATLPDAALLDAALLDAALPDAGLPDAGLPDAALPDAGPAGAVTTLAAGWDHDCVIFSDGRVKCWGRNLFGGLGLGDQQPRGDTASEMGDALPFVDLGTGRTAVSISLGQDHSCAILDDATMKCWGENLAGQLGIGDEWSRGDAPGEMGDALPSIDLGTGETPVVVRARSQSNCASLAGGEAKCWGNNSSGELGLGDLLDRGDMPDDMGDALPAVDLGDGLTAVSMCSGQKHACAALDDGSVKCWGCNFYGGELGAGNVACRGDGPGEMGDALPAVDLGSGTHAVSVDCGYAHTCALLDDGAVKCWGSNSWGQLGLGDSATRGDQLADMGDALPFVDLGTGRTAMSIELTGVSTCALLDDASVKCWGNGSFGISGAGDQETRGDGPGEMGDALAAVDLGTGRTALAIAVAYSHACALLDDGTVKCWGYNAIGELGLGDLEHRGDDPGEMGDALPPVLLQ